MQAWEGGKKNSVVLKEKKSPSGELPNGVEDEDLITGRPFGKCPRKRAMSHCLGRKYVSSPPDPATTEWSRKSYVGTKVGITNLVMTR